MKENENLYLRKETLLNEGYLQKWTIYEAAKEFTQNYVFALQNLNVKGNTYYDKEKHFAVWEDQGKGFDLSCLLMGVGQQKEIENAPGENSEGMKVSLLIACRENKHCNIEIPGYTIVPKLGKGNFGKNELVLYIYNNNRITGTKFELECNEETYNRAIESFGYLVAKEEDRYKFSESSIIDENSNGQNLYINGVKINTSMKMLFSYNLTGKSLSNRDRNAISPYDICYEIWKQIFSKLKDKNKIKTIIENISNNTIETYYSYPYFLTMDVKDIWQDCFKELHGNKICYCTGDKSDNRARYRKFKTLKTPVNGMLQLLSEFNIKSSAEIAPDKEPKKEYIQLKDLYYIERDNINSVRKLIQKHYCSKIYNLRFCNNLTDEHENPLDGLCSNDEELIYLNKLILSDWDKLFQTLLHEAVHQVSKADDCSEEFEREWAKACLSFAKGCTRNRN